MSCMPVYICFENETRAEIKLSSSMAVTEVIWLPPACITHEVAICPSVQFLQKEGYYGGICVKENWNDFVICPE